MAVVLTDSCVLVRLIFMLVIIYSVHATNNADKRNVRERSSFDENESLVTIRELKILKRVAENRLGNLNEYTVFRSKYLRHLLKVRVPGTRGHHEVKDFIIKNLKSSGWDVQLDEFVSDTPIGKKKFTNIIGVLNPAANRYLALAAHYDSMLMDPKKGQYFLGATDSAVPCAMLLDFANLLATQSRNKTLEVSPMVIFLDGEEAFDKWTKTDSLYGSRHLAKLLSHKRSHMRHPTDKWVSMLDSLDAFVLFDLIGAKNPQFFDIYPKTTRLYTILQNIEKRLWSLGKISNRKPYFYGKPKERVDVDDDHQPFLQRGVPILHLISVPFPSVWHKLTDNESAIDEDTVINLLHIFRQFLLEYFNLVKRETWGVSN